MLNCHQVMLQSRVWPIVHQQPCSHERAMKTHNAGAEPGVQEASPCVVKLSLRFQHRPEWVHPGQTLLMRDRTDNCLAAAGVITDVSGDC